LRNVIGRLRSLNPTLVDGAVALLLALLAEFELLIADLSPQERIANALTVPFMTLPLVLRRRAPIFALVLMIAASRVQVTVGGTQRDGGTIPILAIMVAIYSMAAAVSLGKALVGAAVVLAVGVTIPPVTTEDVVFRSILEMVPWTLGRVVRSRQRRVESIEDRALGLERDQAARVAAATAEERVRIARELHDIVAHSVGVMVIQATGAQKVLDARPQRAREALQSIETTGRQALDELHRVLGILRTDSGRESLNPQPGLSDLDGLLEQVRQGGLPVEATIVGEARQLPRGIELAAYRIVQEALTNSLRHGGGTRASLIVRYGDRDLAVEVCDDGRGTGAAGINASGHGLVGMRERVGLYGGSLIAGPLPRGGYSVKALIPLDR